jgi:polyisoprenyl-phosphate glycosyltransferase
MKKNQNSSHLQEVIISVILIIHNYENGIENVIKNTHEILSEKYPNYEIIVVDNNSDDKTHNKLRGMFKEITNIRIIRLSRKYSIEIAYTAGVDNCIGDYAVIIDPRMASPKLIPLFVEKLLNNYDIVYLRPNKNFSKWSAKRGFLFFLEKLSKNKFAYESAHMFAFNRKLINTFTTMRRKSRNFIYLSNSLGFSQTTIHDSSTKIKKEETPHFFEFLFIVSDIIISNSFKPMRFLAIIGILINLFLLLYILFALIAAISFNVYFISKDLLGIYLIILLLFFFLFSLLTVMSEYMIRILDETRNEPLYFISDEIDKSIISLNKKQLNIYKKN